VCFFVVGPSVRWFSQIAAKELAVVVVEMSDVAAVGITQHHRSKPTACSSCDLRRLWVRKNGPVLLSARRKIKLRHFQEKTAGSSG
jgi:hypothetical protein